MGVKSFALSLQENFSWSERCPFFFFWLMQQQLAWSWDTVNSCPGWVTGRGLLEDAYDKTLRYHTVCAKEREAFASELWKWLRDSQRLTRLERSWGCSLVKPKLQYLWAFIQGRAKRCIVFAVCGGTKVIARKELGQRRKNQGVRKITGKQARRNGALTYRKGGTKTSYTPVGFEKKH